MKVFTITATPVRTLPQMQAQGVKAATIQDSINVNQERIKWYPQEVATILAKHGMDGFTIYEVQGYWKGIAETSFKIEIAIDSDPERVYTVAEELRALYNQDAVMLTLPNNSVKFI